MKLYCLKVVFFNHIYREESMMFELLFMSSLLFQNYCKSDFFFLSSGNKKIGSKKLNKNAFHIQSTYH